MGARWTWRRWPRGEEQLRRNYRVTVSPTPERVAGVAPGCSPRRPSRPGKPWRRLWLDVENGFPLRVEKHYASGGRSSLE